MAGAHGLSLDEVFEGVVSGVRMAERDFPIKVRLIAGPTQMWRERGWHSPMEVVEAAIDYKGKGVVGFGLASESKEGDLYKKANPVEWELGANRIGHGVKVIENQEILRKVIEMKVPLEICLISNVMSGAVSSITEHPFRRLY